MQASRHPMGPARRVRLCGLLCAALLPACGGGISIGFFDDDGDPFFDRPFRSGRAASVTVRAASAARLDGSYAASDVRLTPVFRFGPRGSTPETCRFQFDGLQHGTASLPMGGEIQYLPGTDRVRASFVVIDAEEYALVGDAAATVDRGANAVAYSGAVLTATQGSGRTITLDGRIPMRNEAKPAGC